MQKRTLTQHLDPLIGPKRILSLDGGGVRGALTLGYLHHIEKIIQEKHGSDYRLCDYFDLIGGTSTGAIIAACLAKGMVVSEISELYMKLASQIFQNKRFDWQQAFKLPWYSEKPLEEQLKMVFGNMTMESPEFKTGLCIITKRADTNSLWPLFNNPKGKYMITYKNKDIFVVDALRASSAAPFYFKPTVINIGGIDYSFVDGGVSSENNPSLRLLMIATMKEFNIGWKMGPEAISVVSVGTGQAKYNLLPKKVVGMSALEKAKKVPDMLMDDANWLNQIMMQWLSDSPTAVEIDEEMGTLKNDFISGSPLIKYIRYNMIFTPELIKKYLNFSATGVDIENLLQMDNAVNCENLHTLGFKHGFDIVEEKHFS